ncbi:MAG: hypothetical protein U9Q70_02280 [Chloroflexota bacterium]|nr:hypothetical protein [Chloroflexota bacterium]
MKINLLDWRWILLITVLPLLAGLLFISGVHWHGLVRYDEKYFTPQYQEKYAAPGMVARALETALQEADAELLAELQGRSSPGHFQTGPSMIFIMLWEQNNPYFTYLYFNMDDYRRYPYYIEPVKGRWVVSTADPYYYLRSGEWLKFSIPVAIVWWLLETVTLLGLWVYRLSARMKEAQGR